MSRKLLVPALLMILVFGTCQRVEEPPKAVGGTPEVVSSPALSSPTPTPIEQDEVEPRLPEGVSPSPEWLGRRVLPIDAEGFGIAEETPRILRDRRLMTNDFLSRPEGRGFVATSVPVPPGVLRRSTWNHSCPVKAKELAYLTMTFWGFDERPHTGEMIVHKSVAKDVLSVFRRIYRNRWPIEEMRVTARRELNAPPTGDGNNTSAFVCRDARLSDEWSQHAYGLAIDMNPFHNPYVRGDLVLPELAIAYSDRSWRRPGMLRPGDLVTEAFAEIGWGWGGDWNSTKDWMHFSLSGS